MCIHFDCPYNCPVLYRRCWHRAAVSQVDEDTAPDPKQAKHQPRTGRGGHTRPAGDQDVVVWPRRCGKFCVCASRTLAMCGSRKQPTASSFAYISLLLPTAQCKISCCFFLHCVDLNFLKDKPILVVHWHWSLRVHSVRVFVCSTKFVVEDPLRK